MLRNTNILQWFENILAYYNSNNNKKKLSQLLLTYFHTQVVTRSEGRLHSLTLRKVDMAHGGFVKIVAKDFQAQAKLTVNGKTFDYYHIKLYKFSK